LPVVRNLALAGHGDRFDGQQFATHLGPGQAGDRTDLVLFLAGTMAEFPYTGKVGDVFRRELNLLGLAFQNLPQRLASDLGDLALEGPHTRLARVVADEIAQARLSEDEFAVLETVALNLLVDQVRVAISTFSSSV
jgi:hypothetical protein